MNSADFQLISGILKDRSGLVLNEEKIYLLESRLTPLARRQGLEDLAELINVVRTKKPEGLLEQITEAMTTNESFFFRDVTPFDLLRGYVFPMLREARSHTKRLRIWCAAASNGQEPYSIAMILQEQIDKWKDWKIEILGTDLAPNVLAKAQKGLYSQFEVQRGLPATLLIKYFDQDGTQWRIKEVLRNMVRFRPYNLLDNITTLGRFDIIFCRNVLIYFDAPTKTEVLEKMAKILPDDGILFLGAAETVLGITNKFKPVREKRGLYCANPTPNDSAIASLTGQNRASA